MTSTTPSAAKWDEIHAEYPKLYEALDHLYHYQFVEKNYPILDREARIAKNFFQLASGAETLESLNAKMEEENDKRKKKHPILSWLLDLLPSQK